MREHEVVTECVMARGDGGVSGEHTVRGHRLEGGIERQIVYEVLAQELEDQERRVTFVQVKHRRCNAERAEGLDAPRCRE